MTRKDYVLIATALRAEAVHLDSPTPTPRDEMGPRERGMFDQWSTVVLTMATALQGDSGYDVNGNRRFDRDRFLVACGMTR